MGTKTPAWISAVLFLGTIVGSSAAAPGLDDAGEYAPQGLLTDPDATQATSEADRLLARLAMDGADSRFSSFIALAESGALPRSGLADADLDDLGVEPGPLPTHLYSMEPVTLGLGGGSGLGVAAPPVGGPPTVDGGDGPQPDTPDPADPPAAQADMATGCDLSGHCPAAAVLIGSLAAWLAYVEYCFGAEAGVGAGGTGATSLVDPGACPAALGAAEELVYMAEAEVYRAAAVVLDEAYSCAGGVAYVGGAEAQPGADASATGCHDAIVGAYTQVEDAVGDVIRAALDLVGLATAMAEECAAAATVEDATGPCAIAQATLTALLTALQEAVDAAVQEIAACANAFGAEIPDAGGPSPCDGPAQEAGAALAAVQEAVEDAVDVATALVMDCVGGVTGTESSGESPVACGQAVEDARNAAMAQIEDCLGDPSGEAPVACGAQVDLLVGTAMYALETAVAQVADCVGDEADLPEEGAGEPVTECGSYVQTALDAVGALQDALLEAAAYAVATAVATVADCTEGEVDADGPDEGESLAACGEAIKTVTDAVDAAVAVVVATLEDCLAGADVEAPQSSDADPAAECGEAVASVLDRLDETREEVEDAVNAALADVLATVADCVGSGATSSDEEGTSLAPCGETIDLALGTVAYAVAVATATVEDCLEGTGTDASSADEEPVAECGDQVAALLQTLNDAQKAIADAAEKALADALATVADCMGTTAADEEGKSLAPCGETLQTVMDEVDAAVAVALATAQDCLEGTGQGASADDAEPAAECGDHVAAVQSAAADVQKLVESEAAQALADALATAADCMGATSPADEEGTSLAPCGETLQAVGDEADGAVAIATATVQDCLEGTGQGASADEAEPAAECGDHIAGAEDTLGDFQELAEEESAQALADVLATASDCLGATDTSAEGSSLVSCGAYVDLVLTTVGQVQQTVTDTAEEAAGAVLALVADCLSTASSAEAEEETVDCDGTLGLVQEAVDGAGQQAVDAVDKAFADAMDAVEGCLDGSEDSKVDCQGTLGGLLSKLSEEVAKVGVHLEILDGLDPTDLVDPEDIGDLVPDPDDVITLIEDTDPGLGPDDVTELIDDTDPGLGPDDVTELIDDTDPGLGPEDVVGLIEDNDPTKDVDPDELLDETGKLQEELEEIQDSLGDRDDPGDLEIGLHLEPSLMQSASASSAPEGYEWKAVDRSDDDEQDEWLYVGNQGTGIQEGFRKSVYVRSADVAAAQDVRVIAYAQTDSDGCPGDDSQRHVVLSLNSVSRRIYACRGLETAGPAWVILDFAPSDISPGTNAVTVVPSEREDEYRTEIMFGYDMDTDRGKTWAHPSGFDTENEIMVVLEILVPESEEEIAPPDADLDVTPTTGDTSTRFEADARGSTGDAVDYQWNWGDGTGTYQGSSREEHVYNKPGEYTVTLTVRNIRGADTVTQKVIVEKEATAPEACLTVTGDQRTYNTLTMSMGCSTDEDGLANLELRHGFGRYPRSTWAWRSYSAANSTWNMEFANEGRYDYTLQVRNEHGLTDVVTETLDIKPKELEVACYDVSSDDGSPYTAGEEITVDASCTDDWYHDEFDYEFKFNRASYHFRGGGVAVLSYSQPGIHTGQVTAWTRLESVGESPEPVATATVTILITNADPVPCFDYTPAEGGTTKTLYGFDAGCSDDHESPTRLTYAWDFGGDGTTDATGVRASHRFGEVGVHEVVLTVSDPHGGSAVTNRTFFVSDVEVVTHVSEWIQSTTSPMDGGNAAVWHGDGFGEATPGRLLLDVLDDQASATFYVPEDHYTIDWFGQPEQREPGTVEVHVRGKAIGCEGEGYALAILALVVNGVETGRFSPCTEFPSDRQGTAVLEFPEYALRLGDYNVVSLRYGGGPRHVGAEIVFADDKDPDADITSTLHDDGVAVDGYLPWEVIASAAPAYETLEMYETHEFTHVDGDHWYEHSHTVFILYDTHEKVLQHIKSTEDRDGTRTTWSAHLRYMDIEDEFQPGNHYAEHGNRDVVAWDDYTREYGDPSSGTYYRHYVGNFETRVDGVLDAAQSFEKIALLPTRPPDDRYACNDGTPSMASWGNYPGDPYGDGAEPFQMWMTRETRADGMHLDTFHIGFHVVPADNKVPRQLSDTTAMLSSAGDWAALGLEKEFLKNNDRASKAFAGLAKLKHIGLAGPLLALVSTGEVFGLTLQERYEPVFGTSFEVAFTEITFTPAVGPFMYVPPYVPAHIVPEPSGDPDWFNCECRP